jgi:lipopolysaccharide export system permease protein
MNRPLRMWTLDRYLALTVAQSFLLALATLVAVFSVINATEELQQVGTGQYGVREALWFVVLTLPNEAYALFPAAALLGSVIGLGGLAQRNELVAIAAAGVSRSRVVWSVLQTAAVLALAGVLLSELVGAPLAYRARSERSAALSNGRTLTTGGGIWTRAGSSFVNMRTLLPSGAARDIYVYDFDEQHRMRRFTHAQAASYADRRWRLEGLVDRVIGDDGVTTEQVAARDLPIELNPRQLGLMRMPPEELSLADLYRGIGAARRQGESATHLELAWWQRATTPVVTAIMVLLAIALVLSSERSVKLGHRIIVGALLGIGFQLFNQTFASFGLVYGLAPWLGALFPALLALAVGMWCLARTPR